MSNPPMRLNYGRRMERFAMRPPELDKKLNLLVGSVRSGKTWGLHSKILYLCRYPVAGRRILTGVSKSSIKTNVLQDLWDLVGPKNYTFNAQAGEMTLFGTKWWLYGAKDEGSEKYLRGATVGAAVCDELVLHPRPFFEMLLSRMSPKGARLYASTNTDSANHWLRTDYILNEKLQQDLWHDTYTMRDNPNLEPDYVESQMRLYTGVFFRRMILGEWVTSSGAIFGDAWSEANLYDETTRKSGLYGYGGQEAHYIAIDYGSRNPTCFLDCIDDGHTVWVDREYYHDSRKAMYNKTDSDYADDLAKFIAESNCPHIQPLILVDPSAASFKDELASRGSFWVQDADNEVLDGIRRMGSALKQLKIRVHSVNCPNTVREVPEYSWDDRAIKLGEEKPKKVADHAVDPCRYMTNHVFRNPYRLSAA